MAVYAIGDLQGCEREFSLLLERVGFGLGDELWLLGDLINRGPNSLAVLRLVKSLGDRCKIVLGNHDLHFLAVYFGGHSGGKSDTFDELLAAPDVEELAHWLRGQRLLYSDASRNCVMVHAGIPHIWSVAEALSYAQEVERVIAGRDQQLSYTEFFTQMYGNEPATWDPGLTGMARVRLITNYLTRMRLVSPQGALDFAHKGALGDAPRGWRPWFDYVSEDPQKPLIVFGHWAALDGVTGRNDIVALDTGCVWGRSLTAMNLATSEKTAVQALP